MDNNILSALAAINVAELTRADWIAVGMALKEEGFPCSVWDDWSQNDSRYHAGECQKKWDGDGKGPGLGSLYRGSRLHELERHH